MFKYFNNFDRPANSEFDYPKIKYDEIVDASHYSSDTKTVSDFMRSEIDRGSGLRGLYDYEDGKIPSDPHLIPSNIEIQIRNGQLTSAEIQSLSEQLEIAISEAISKSEKKEFEKKRQAILEARQAFLDSQTGFEPPKEE